MVDAPVSNAFSNLVPFTQFTGMPVSDTKGLAGLKPAFADHLQDLLQDAPDYGVNAGVTSGFRDPVQQAALWQRQLALSGGDASAARHFVAPPGGSMHNAGMAADLFPADSPTLHAMAPDYGLTFPMPWEPWHIEPAGGRGAAVAAGAPAPPPIPASRAANGVSAAGPAPSNLGQVASAIPLPAAGAPATPGFNLTDAVTALAGAPVAQQQLSTAQWSPPARPTVMPPPTKPSAAAMLATLLGGAHKPLILSPI